jgi:UDP-glucuronate decarboxylase
MAKPASTPKRRIVVAGGAGFLGSHLCEALVAGGNRVICIDNFDTGSRQNIAALTGLKNFRLVPHDVIDPIKLGEPVDQVYNLACVASPPRYQADPVQTMMTSVLGTRNLLDLASRNGATLVQASTSEVYGDPEQHPQAEEYWGHVNPTGPRACYDEGKRAAEALCFDYLRLGKADVRVARIFNTYGPRMQPDDGRIVSNLICQALSGRPLTIYGSGEQTRSFCYVSDLIRGLVALMNATPTTEQPVNLGNPGEFSINQLAELVLRLTRARSTPVRRPLPVDDPRRRRPDIERAMRLLGWKPEVPLEEGLRLTIAYFVEQQQAAGAPTLVPAPQPGTAIVPVGAAARQMAR